MTTSFAGLSGLADRVTPTSHVRRVVDLWPAVPDSSGLVLQ